MRGGSTRWRPEADWIQGPEPVATIQSLDYRAQVLGRPCSLRLFGPMWSTVGRRWSPLAGIPAIVRQSKRRNQTPRRGESGRPGTPGQTEQRHLGAEVPGFYFAGAPRGGDTDLQYMEITQWTSGLCLFVVSVMAIAMGSLEMQFVLLTRHPL